MNITAYLTYFKPSGKYYGATVIKLTVANISLSDIIDVVCEQKTLPDLQHPKDYFILVEVPSYSLVRLIPPRA